MLCFYVYLVYCVLKNMFMVISLKYLIIFYFKIKCFELIVIWFMYMFVRVDNVVVFVVWGWGLDIDFLEGYVGLFGI